MTSEQKISMGAAIAASIRSNGVFRLNESNCTPSTLADLICEAASDNGDSALVDDVWAFWGTTKSGSKWYVHVILDSANKESETAT